MNFVSDYKLYCRNHTLTGLNGLLVGLHIHWSLVGVIWRCHYLTKWYAVPVRDIMQHTTGQHDAAHLVGVVKQHTSGPIKAAPPIFQLPNRPLYN